VDSADNLLGTPRIPHRTPGRFDVRIECGLTDNLIGPEGAEEFRFRDNAVAVAAQIRQHFKHFDPLGVSGIDAIQLKAF
jgi:hypothetical protein